LLRRLSDSCVAPTITPDSDKIAHITEAFILARFYSSRVRVRGRSRSRSRAINAPIATGAGW
jgi:hypothetical protein